MNLAFTQVCGDESSHLKKGDRRSSVWSLSQAMRETQLTWQKKKEVWSGETRLALFWSRCKKLWLAETQPCTRAQAQHPHSETWFCGSIMLWR